MDFFIRIVVKTLHPAIPGMDAYEATALDIAMQEGHVDHTCLAASQIVLGLQHMYAGDNVSVDVWLNGSREDHVSSVGIMGRTDPTIQGMAQEIESWGR